MFSIFNQRSDEKVKKNKKRKAEEKEEEVVVVEYECPMCGRTFRDSSFLQMHVTSHFSSEKSPQRVRLMNDERVKKLSRVNESKKDDILLKNEGKENDSTDSLVDKESNQVVHNHKNAFSVIMNTKQTQNKNIIHFSLNLIDGKLLPIFSFNPENGHVTDSSDSGVVWSAIDIKLRKINSSYTPSNSHCMFFEKFLNGTNVLSLTTNIPSSKPKMNSRKAYMTNPGLVSIFKSMIQKGFRRGCVNQCLMLCLQLMQEHPEECLRRLPIILVEDGILHSGTPIIVWLMIAMSKGYFPPDFLLAHCIQIFVEGAHCSVRDHIAWKGSFFDTNYGDSIHTTNGEQDAMNEADNNNQSTDSQRNIEYSFAKLHGLPACSTLVGSLLLRMTYGGMPGDMSMLWKFAVVWCHRLMSCVNSNYVQQDYECNAVLGKMKYNFLHEVYLKELFRLEWGRRLISVSSIELNSLTHATANIEIIDECHGCEWIWIFDFVHNCLHRAEDNSQLYCAAPQLTRTHLVPEGIDFHCDNKLVDFLMNVLHNNSESRAAYEQWVESDSRNVGIDMKDALKTTCWQFRSSFNTRKVWIEALSIEENDDFQRRRKDVLDIKSQYAGMWKLMCPFIKEYCHKKLPRICP